MVQFQSGRGQILNDASILKSSINQAQKQNLQAFQKLKMEYGSSNYASTSGNGSQASKVAHQDVASYRVVKIGRPSEQANAPQSQHNKSEERGSGMKTRQSQDAQINLTRQRSTPNATYPEAGNKQIQQQVVTATKTESQIPAAH